MGNSISKSLTGLVVFLYGLFTVALYGLIAIRKGTFFKKRTERQNLELQLARDRLWNLSKEYAGLSHHFLTLADGFKFHFVSNEAPGAQAALASDRPLVIFIHGFPDSWAVWRHIASSSTLQASANLVAIDMPGYGGTKGLDKYSATNLLEKLTELIIALRTQYGVDDGTQANKKRVTIVAHDWGCVLAMRLAAEAPSLAHRFIFTNGPLPSLARSNISRMLSSASKMLKTAIAAPLSAMTPLTQALRTLGPVAHQTLLSGYIFAMQLPPSLVVFCLTGGNYSLMSSIHKGSHGRGEYTPSDEGTSMASSMGPSAAEAKTQTSDGESYPSTIDFSHDFANIMNQANYYRQGAAVARWHKSAETVANLHSISASHQLRHPSGGTGLLDDGLPGALQAPATVFWGQHDVALSEAVCLDGLADYLTSNSQIVMLPESGHFTPIEPESRAALTKAVEWAVNGEEGDIVAKVRECYPNATLVARR
ncbi:Epoxide hydrolase 3 [Penicillium ucsense]|uniref:Epoxide hydrolase 3 n=1 Tax=Penicillium ucsense TaxID=2839758 RepID=A0A8J8WIK4_9EURO|nr:Epoxide hydrolase 3 [Penicillium ucsense]KAF7734848.1 Epoxide hydrolase 3 [Penicillium ucsense]